MTITQRETKITESLILKGDLSALASDDKVTYYKGYCERLGLDPFTKPFDILRLNGRDVLYLTRAGAQQLNKLHGVSHAITSRELMAEAGIFQVVARATLPDGRFTESMSAVSVSNLKGEAYCNALMKAETKAKRRATLDLLGLGILSEEETITIEGATKAPEIALEAEEVHTSASVIDPAQIVVMVSECRTVSELNGLYLANQQTVESNNMREVFSKRKKEIQNSKA